MSKLVESLNHLFISKVRIKALKYFVFNPDVPIHLRGAVREFDEEINAVRRELTRLEEIGFVKSEERGNRKYFALNPTHPLLDELTGIFHKTFGLGGAIIKNAEKLGQIRYAVLTESFVNGGAAGNVDLFIVGQVELNQLSVLIDEVQKKINREINYSVLRPAEFDVRKKRRDAFIMQVMLSAKVMLIGKRADFLN